MLPVQTPEDILKLDDSSLLATWVELSKQASHIKNLESTARKLCVDRFFSNTGKKGTFRKPAGESYELKCVKKLNYKISTEKEAIENVKAMLSKHSDIAGVAGGLVFKQKYELDSKVYEGLSTDIQNILANVVTISDATPSLELIEKSA